MDVVLLRGVSISAVDGDVIVMMVCIFSTVCISEICSVYEMYIFLYPFTVYFLLSFFCVCVSSFIYLSSCDCNWCI